MAARKRGSSKKKVTIEIDIDTLRALVDAADALSEVAGAWVEASADPRVRAIKRKKGARRRSRR